MNDEATLLGDLNRFFYQLHEGPVGRHGKRNVISNRVKVGRWAQIFKAGTFPDVRYSLWDASENGNFLLHGRVDLPGSVEAGDTLTLSAPEMGW